MAGFIFVPGPYIEHNDLTGLYSAEKFLAGYGFHAVPQPEIMAYCLIHLRHPTFGKGLEALPTPQDNRVGKPVERADSLFAGRYQPRIF
jgi:hypothetical protein